MAVYVLQLKVRPGLAQAPTEQEQEVMAAHGAHWRPYMARGAAVVFGPAVSGEDGCFGLAVVEAEDEAALRAHADADPAVQAGVGKFEFSRLVDGAFVRPSS